MENLDNNITGIYALLKNAAAAANEAENEEVIFDLVASVPNPEVPKCFKLQEVYVIRTNEIAKKSLLRIRSLQTRFGLDAVRTVSPLYDVTGREFIGSLGLYLDETAKVLPITTKAVRMFKRVVLGRFIY